MEDYFPPPLLSEWALRPFSAPELTKRERERETEKYDSIYMTKDHTMGRSRQLSWIHVQLVIRRLWVRPPTGRQNSFVEIFSSHSLSLSLRERERETKKYDSIYMTKDHTMGRSQQLSWIHVQLVIRRLWVRPPTGRQNSFVEIFSSHSKMRGRGGRGGDCPLCAKRWEGKCPPLIILQEGKCPNPAKNRGGNRPTYLIWAGGEMSRGGNVRIPHTFTLSIIVTKLSDDNCINKA